MRVSKRKQWGTLGEATLKEKICYGFSCMSYNLEICVIGTYLMLFCTDIMKIDPIMVGALFLIIRFVDAITDVIITNIADKTCNRWGRYRPWMLLGIPLAFVLILSFWYPNFLQSQFQMIVWLGVCLVLVDIFETATYMPTMVMGTTMSANEHDRLDFAASRSLGEYAAELIISAFCMTIILHFGSYKNISGWRCMSIVFAILMIIATIVGFSGTKERVFSSNRSQEGKQLGLFQKLSVLKQNKPFAKVLILQVAFALQWQLVMMLFSFFCIHNLGHEEWMSLLTSIGVAATIGTVALIPYIGRVFNKRLIVFIGGLL